MKETVGNSMFRLEDADLETRERQLAETAIPSFTAPPAVSVATPIDLESEGRVSHARLIALIGGAQAMMLIAGMGRLKLIAMFLGPRGMGIAGVIDPTAQLALQLGALNIPTAALRFLSIAREERGAQGFAWLYRTLLRILLTTTALVAALALALFLISPARLGSATTSSYALAIALALAAVPLTGTTNFIRNVLATLHRHQASAIAFLASSVLLIGATFIGLRTGGLTGAYLGALLVGVVTVTTLHSLVAPTLRLAPSSGSGSLVGLLKAHPDIVAFSMTMYAVGFAVPLGYWVVRWTVLGQLGEREAGFLAAAYAIASGLRVVFSQASAQYLIPLVSRSTAKESRVAESGKYIRTLLLLLFTGCLPLLLFPHELIVALYSRAFLPAIGVIGLFILAEAVMSIGDNYRVLLLGLNDLRGCLVMTCSSALAIIAGSFWVVPRFGLLGMALLQLTAAALVLLWSIDRLRSRHDLRVESRSLAMTAYVILVLGAAIAIGRWASSPQLGWIAAKAAIGLAMFLGGILVLPPHERRATLALVRRRGGTTRS